MIHNLDDVVSAGHELFLELLRKRLKAVGKGESTIPNTLRKQSVFGFSEYSLEEQCNRYFDILAESQTTHWGKRTKGFVSSITKILSFANLFMSIFDDSAFGSKSTMNHPSFLLLSWHREHVGTIDVVEAQLTEEIRRLVKFTLHGYTAHAARSLFLVLNELCRNSPEMEKDTFLTCFSAVSLVVESFPSPDCEPKIECGVSAIATFWRAVRHWQHSFQSIEETVTKILDRLQFADEDKDQGDETTSIIKKVFLVFGGRSKQALIDIIQYAGLSDDHYWLLCGDFVYFHSEEGPLNSISDTFFAVIAKAPLQAFSNYFRHLENIEEDYFRKCHSISAKKHIDVQCLDTIAQYSHMSVDGCFLKNAFVQHVLTSLLDWFDKWYKTSSDKETCIPGSCRTFENLQCTSLKEHFCPGFSGDEKHCYGILLWVIVHWMNVHTDPFYPKSKALSQFFESIYFEYIRLIYSTRHISPSKFLYCCTYLLCTPLLRKAEIFSTLLREMYENYHENSAALYECLELASALFSSGSHVQTFLRDQYRDLYTSSDNLFAENSTALRLATERTLMLHISKHVCHVDPGELYFTISKYFSLLGNSASLENFQLLLGVIGVIHSETSDSEAIFLEAFGTDLTQKIVTPETLPATSELCRAFLCTFGAFIYNHHLGLDSNIGDAAFTQLCQSAFLLEEGTLKIEIATNPDAINSSLLDNYIMCIRDSKVVEDSQISTHVPTVLLNEWVPLAYRISFSDLLIKVINRNNRTVYPLFSNAVHSACQTVRPRIRDTILSANESNFKIQ